MKKTPVKLTLNKETVRKLVQPAPESPRGAHPTTTVNTIKTGCC